MRDLNISHVDNTSDFKANWIEIQSQNNKIVLVAVIYHHPRKKHDSESIKYPTNISCSKLRKEK